MKTISKRQRSMLPRTAFVLIVIGIAYITIPDRLSFSSKEDLIRFSTRQLLQAENSDETITDNSESDSSDSTISSTVKPEEKVCKALKEKDANASDDPLFPTDLFSEDQLKHGAVSLHILGIIYMFYALALVCDEFFVPSLDVITEKLGISPDVAGATFMAAGGSAPELFTSIIGVFIAKSDVGIGTIVGSAVFNILFVIAACAFAAKEALSLTAWPLIRDVFFYSVSLILLVVFFLDERIYHYEAGILFFWYFAYVGFMRFNEGAEDALRKLFRLPESSREGLDRGCTIRKAAYRKGLYHLMNETINPGIMSVMIGYHQGYQDSGITGPTGLGGLKDVLEKDAPGEATAPQDNGKEMDEVEAPKVNNPETTTTTQDANNTKNPDNAGDNNAETGTDDKKEDEDEEEPIDMSFKKAAEGGWKQIIVYLISFPLMFPLYLTLPDTKDKKKRKFFIITFFGSILWIAAYSYLMVWWATVAGETIGIPPPVMGLTFLAAGTSVPDLITSVLVAKQGKGDMAVSSSVGSNIFDVTVGLPLPWLIYTLVRQEPVTVSSDGVGCSISLLFLMLILVFLSILAFNWKMTKGMGIIMGIFYFIFVIVSLGFSYCWYICPV